MSTATKILAVMAVLGVAGAGFYLYLKNQNKNSTPVSGGQAGNTLLPGPNPPGSQVQPTKEDMKAAAEHVLDQTNETVKQAAEVLFQDSPVPLPKDMSIMELQGLKDFCSLKEGSKWICKPGRPGLSGLSMPDCSLNMDISTRWGLSNHLQDRSGASIKMDEYYGKLKSYRGC